MGGQRVYFGRALYEDGTPIARASVVVARGTAPTPEIAKITDEQGRFALGLPEGEFELVVRQRARTWRARLVTSLLSSHYVIRESTSTAAEGSMTTSVSSESSEGSDELALASVSNDAPARGREFATALPLPTVGGEGAKVDAPGLSARVLLVKPDAPRKPRAPKRVFETVLGRDERTRILDVEDAPWRMIASLVIHDRFGGTSVGTGWFAGPHTLITAGHCVHLPEMGGWARSIDVIVGRNRDAQPIATLTSKRFSSTEKWMREQDADFDYAAIHLDPAEAEAVTAKTGWFSTAVLGDDALDAKAVNVSGYPGDKGDPIGCEQWFHSKHVVHVAPLRVYYDMDTFGGQSGSPVWLEADEGRKVIGIHAYGADGAQHLGLRANSGPRITADVLALIKSWIAKR
ncbi:MAG: trypsin-like peptidase domain-containing protein [Myxococcales bacterium]|nr:trypsin-like peptidase domain-containing protein [Myxococcales bacterium]